MVSMKFRLSAAILLASLLTGQFGLAQRCTIPLSEIRSFAPVYFKDDSLRDLNKFDMVILDPDNYSRNQVYLLKKLGTIPFAYLNVGEIEEYRDYMDTLDPSIALSPDALWNHRYFANICDTLWIKLVETRVREILMDGFCGVYADFGGLLKEYPNLRSCAVNLVRKMKSSAGNAYLIVNAEPTIIDQLGHMVDGICVEGLIGKYDFESDSYKTNDIKSTDSLVTFYTTLAGKFKITIFDIEYAGAFDLRARRTIVASIRKFGFIPYVGTIELDTLFFDSIRHIGKKSQ